VESEGLTSLSALARLSRISYHPQNGVIMNTIQNIYDSLAPDYDSRYREVRHFVEETLIGQILDEMEFGAIDRVLDIGCGTGNMITVAELPQSAYLGVDVSEGMLEVARENYPDYEFLNIDIANQKVGEFDLILSIFGQCNYIGLEDWAKTVSLNLADRGRFLSVMYSSGYKPDYINGEAKLYTADEVSSCLIEHGLPHTMLGLSFPVVGDGAMEFVQLHTVQEMMMRSGQLDDCHYWVVWG